MSKNNSETLSELLQKITFSRNRMHKLWKEKGYNTDFEVLAASIELDDLLNQYYLLDP
jgi:hypothetical protein